MTIPEDIHRLCICKTINDSQDCLDLFAKFLWRVIEVHTQESVKQKKEHEAKLMLQMMFTKILHLKEILKGVSYSSKEGAYLNNIIDPGVVAILSRNIYETAALFNLIYRQPKTEDEQDIVYNLWRHAGLKNRQRFKESFEETDRKSEIESERRDMNRISEIIETNSLFLSLDEFNQTKILNRLDKGEYLVRFVNKQVKVLHWQSLADVMEIRKEQFDNLYSYFSLYIHPSNVAVFQFDELFSSSEQGYLEMTNFNIKTTLYMIGIFIADYIHFFPKIAALFDDLDLSEKHVIDFHNMFGRNKTYSIIDAIKSIA